MALKGNEILQVVGLDASGAPAATSQQTTTGAIAALANQESTSKIITTISTGGAGSLTAPAILGQIIKRAGSQAGTPFTDTTVAASVLIAALPAGAQVGTTFSVVYQNTTNATATIAAGSNVTVSGITTVPAGKSATFLFKYATASTVTLTGYEAGEADAASAQEVILAGSTSGTTTLQASATAAGAQTLPPVTGTIASTTGTNLYLPDLKTCSGTNTSTGNTNLTNVTGLSFTVVPGTYQFEIVLQGVADGTGGIKSAFKYTTTVVSSLQASTVGTTAAASATQSTTSTADQALLFDQAAAVLQQVIKGTMVVGTGGTIAVQVGLHANSGSSTVVQGSYGVFTRIA